MTTLKVGIASYEEMKSRTLAIARGERRVTADEPKVWFTSTESFAKVLSDGNRKLLHIITAEAPNSLDELAKITGRAKSNLSRTLKAMEGYGLISLQRGERGRITPKVMYDTVTLDLPLTRPIEIPLTASPKDPTLSRSLPTSDAIRDAISQSPPMGAHKLARKFAEQHIAEPALGWDLLRNVFDFHFTPEIADRPFGPMMIADGKRSMIPDDVTDDQLTELKTTFEQVDDPEYQARIGDVLWLRRKDPDAARIAVKAYLEAGQRLEDIQRWPPSMERYQRAVRLARQVDPKGALPAVTLRFIEERVRYYDGQDPLYFTAKALDLLAEFRVGHFPELAETAGKVAEAARHSKDYRRERTYLDVQAKLLKLAGNTEAAEVVRVSSAESFVSEAEAHEHAEAFIAAHSFWEDAIHAFRKRPSLRPRLGELHKRLASAGKNALAEMTHHSHETDIREIVERSERAFTGLSVDEALLRLAVTFPLIDPAKLREETLKIAEKHPLQSILAATIVDESGRKIGTRPGLVGADEKTKEAAIEGLMDDHARLQRTFQAQGYLAPALRTIASEHVVVEEEIERLVADSEIIPQERLPLFVRSITQGLQWDFSAALHVLVPQIENGLRYILEKHGVTPRTVKDDGAEEVWSLERVLSHATIKTILGDQFTYELQSLLAGRLGPNLRNALAHGLLSPSSLSGHTALYLWWVLYRLVLAPTSAMRAFMEREKTKASIE